MEEKQTGGSWQSLGGPGTSAALQVEGAAVSEQEETACQERNCAIRPTSLKALELCISKHNTLQWRSIAILPPN